MERLLVILELAAGQYKREAKEAATATSQISSSAKTAETDTAKAAGGMRSSMSGAAMAAKTFIAGAAVTAVLAFGKSSINAASNLEESMNAVRVQFGEAADGIAALGEDSVTSFGMSERAFNEFAVRFSAFADNIAKSSGRSVVEVVDEMTTRIADFASVHNLTMEEAATIAQSTLAGETEAFRRFGGDVSAAAVQLKGMEMGLGDTSAELSEQEKILIRYELFMEQTEKTAGDFAATSDSLANSQKQLSGNIENVQALIGGALVPRVAEAVDMFSDLLTVATAVGDFFGGEGEESTLDFGAAIGFALDNLGPLGTAFRVAGDWLDVLAEATGEATQKTMTLDASLQTGTETLEAYNDAAVINFDTLLSGQPILDRYNELGLENAEAQRAAKEATEGATAALQAHQDELRAQVDPLFALFDATNQQREAQEKLNTLIAEGTTSGPEYEQALADVALAAFDVRDAQADARVETNLTKDAFIDQAVNAGLARDRAKELADQLYGLSGLRLDPIQLAVEIRELRRGAGSQAGGYQEYHTGGVVEGDYVGQEVMARVLVGETIIPIGHNTPMAPPPAASTPAGVTIGAVYAMGTPAKIAQDVGQQVALELRMA